jgi:hypothetical protein
VCGGRPSRNQSQCDVEEEVKDKTDKGDMNNNETGEQVGGGGEGIKKRDGDGDSGAGEEVDGDENTVESPSLCMK